MGIVESAGAVASQAVDYRRKFSTSIKHSKSLLMVQHQEAHFTIISSITTESE